MLGFANHTNKKNGKYLRLALKILLCVITFLASLILFLHLFLIIKNEFVAQKLQDFLRRQTAMQWQVNGKVELSLWPPVSFSIKDLSLASLHGQELAPLHDLLHIKKLECFLDITSLCQGRLVLSEVQVEQPSLILSYDSAGKPTWLPLQEEQAGELFRKNSWTNQVFATNDGASITKDETDAAADTPMLFMQMESLLAKMSSITLPHVLINDGRFGYFSVQGKPYQDLANIDLFFIPSGDRASIEASFDYTAEQANFQSTVSWRLLLGGEESILSGNATGTLSMNQEGEIHTLQGSLSSNVLWPRGENNVYLSDFAIEAEGDKLFGNLNLALNDLSIRGKLQAEQFSLPRWFLFARILTPELQEVLHALQGSFDIYVDKKGVFADNLSIAVGPLHASGFVRVADFMQPVVEVSLSLPHVNVDNIFPFLAPPNSTVPTGVAPVFGHSYLVPFGLSQSATDVKKNDGLKVGYDVQIKSASVSVHGVEGGETRVKVSPASEIPRVEFTGSNLLGGAIRGQLDFEPSLVTMRYTAQRLNLAPLPENQDNEIIADAQLSGTCTITVPVISQKWGDSWGIDLDVVLDNFKLLGGQISGNKWYAATKQSRIKGQGKLFAVPKQGVKVTADLTAENYGAYSSWNPDGADEVSTSFAGFISWPPFNPIDARSRKRQAIEEIKGLLIIEGVYTLPLGNLLIPISGSLSSQLNWLTAPSTLAFSDIFLESFGSQAEGSMLIDFSGKGAVASGSSAFDIDLPTLLKAWEMFPEGINLPRRISGRSDFFADTEKLLFNPASIFVDGDALTGSIRCDFSPASLQRWVGVPTFSARASAVGIENTSAFFGGKLVEGLNLESPLQPGNTLRRAYFTQTRAQYGKSAVTQQDRRGRARANRTERFGVQIIDSFAALWTVRLSGIFLDLDKFFAPAENDAPRANAHTGEPLDVKFLQNLNLDAKLNFEQIIVQGLGVNNVLLDIMMQDKRFNVRLHSGNFYGGSVDTRIQGRVILPDTVQLNVFAAEAQNFDIGQVLNTLTEQTAYSGRGNMGFALSGNLQKQGDIPRNLSGHWNFSVSNGSYPAIIGARSAGQRNAFHLAEASGNMEFGIVQWGNFTMSGPVINMTSSGWVDLDGRVMDIIANVTIARIPFPVRVYGSFDSPRLDIRTTRMALQTAQAAGGTIFSLVRGIFTLPGNVLSVLLPSGTGPSDNLALPLEENIPAPSEFLLEPYIER